MSQMYYLFTATLMMLLTSCSSSDDGDAYDECTALTLAADIWSGPGSSNPASFAVFQESLYFQANDGISGEELWMYNTSEGASLVANIAPGSGGSRPFAITALNDMLYFGASDGIPGHTVWVYDPSKLVDDIELLSARTTGIELGIPDKLIPVNDKLYFTTTNYAQGGSYPRQGLWIYDSAQPNAGIRLLADYDYRRPKFFSVLTGKLYFLREYESFRTDLWVHDPNNSETDSPFSIVYADINLREISELVAIGDRMFVSAIDVDTNYGYELWTFNPTTPEAGFTLVADIVPGSEGSAPRSLTALEGKLYFTAGNIEGGVNIWVYDPIGINAMPMLVADSSVADANNYNAQLMALNGKLILQILYDNSQPVLMVFDPAMPENGLILAADSNQLPNTQWRETTALNGKLYFRADDTVHGNELWVYDADCQLISPKTKRY